MKTKKIKTAYSLLELSIVIIIISILITGALSVSVGSINNIKVKTTNDRMKEIYKAMGNFLVANRRLPCPASIYKIKTVDSDYGAEVDGGAGCDTEDGVLSSTFDSNLIYGMVPVKTLGLSSDLAEDAFESKIVYIVDKRFTSASAIGVSPDFGAANTFSTAPFTTRITVNEKPSGVTQTMTTDAIMVLLSHGSNKAGAFNTNSAAQIARGDTDEQDNDAGTINTTGTPDTGSFDSTVIASSTNSDTFDDIIFFKRRNDFVEDFKAMFLIPCQDAGVAFGNMKNAYYGQVVYATASCANPNEDKRLTRKCEAYGAWIDIVASCPS